MDQRRAQEQAVGSMAQRRLDCEITRSLGRSPATVGGAGWWSRGEKKRARMRVRAREESGAGGLAHLSEIILTGRPVEICADLYELWTCALLNSRKLRGNTKKQRRKRYGQPSDSKLLARFLMESRADSLAKRNQESIFSNQPFQPALPCGAERGCRALPKCRFQPARRDMWRCSGKFHAQAI